MRLENIPTLACNHSYFYLCCKLYAIRVFFDYVDSETVRRIVALLNSMFSKTISYRFKLGLQCNNLLCFGLVWLLKPTRNVLMNSIPLHVMVYFLAGFNTLILNLNHRFPRNFEFIN